MSGHCVKCGKLLHNDTVTIEMPTTFRRQWSYHAECAPTNEPQYHIPPSLLEELKAFILVRDEKRLLPSWGDNGDNQWNAVLSANRKDSK